jgi:uncharacterized cofD-like protein
MKHPALHALRWFYPGLGVKRWLVVAVGGAALTVNGIFRLLTGEGIVFPINEMIDGVVDDVFSPTLLAPIFILLGLLTIFFGIRQWTRAIAYAVRPEGGDRIVDALFKQRKRGGYKIVAIGGGTGLSTLLRGLKQHTTNITAIVTVSDDGGSSGRLRKELGVLPPGDIRNCLVALADDEALVTDLFRYRFSEGEGLSGHSFGNLFLAAMTGVTGNFDDAIRASSQVLNIIGRVLPATLTTVRLCARMRDGSIIEGESNIGRSTQPIDSVYLEPAHPPPLPDVLDAIRDADAIVFGPGSLYTSILPNLLVADVVETINASNAVKIYVCNVMTQPGETAGFSASEHLQALQSATSRRIVDYVIINDERPSLLVERYAQEHQEPVKVDSPALRALGVEERRAAVMSESETVRHDPVKLARVVITIIEQALRRRASPFAAGAHVNAP